MMDVIQICRKYGACTEALEWIERQNDQSAKYVWEHCHRGDWLLWIAARLGVDHKTIVLAACDCAEPTLKHVPKNEKRPRIAIQTARAWAIGKTTTEEVRAAADAARDAANAADAAHVAHAAHAAHAAAEAAAAAVAEAAKAAAKAAAAVVVEAAKAARAAAEAADTARDTVLQQCADIVRKHITWGMIAETRKNII